MPVHEGLKGCRRDKTTSADRIGDALFFRNMGVHLTVSFFLRGAVDVESLARDWDFWTARKKMKKPLVDPAVFIMVSVIAFASALPKYGFWTLFDWDQNGPQAIMTMVAMFWLLCVPHQWGRKRRSADEGATKDLTGRPGELLPEVWSPVNVVLKPSDKGIAFGTGRGDGFRDSKVAGRVIDGAANI